MSWESPWEWVLPKQLPRHLPALQLGSTMQAAVQPNLCALYLHWRFQCRPFPGHDTPCFAKMRMRLTYVKCMCGQRQVRGACTTWLPGVLFRMNSTAAACNSNSGMAHRLLDSRSKTFCLLVCRTTTSCYTTSQFEKQTQPRLLRQADAVQTSRRQGRGSTCSQVLFLTCK